jgi:16S rRNA (guanine966-N2)-methyltransferase
MRISGGIAKGRTIRTKRLFSKASKAEELRPTSSKVREALFDIIRDRIEGAIFVDLYAGTGTVGLESLSRGAREAIFVEPTRLRADAIEETGVQFGFRDKITVVEGTAEGFLKKASTEKKRFDIFFVDPPYFSEEIMKILPLIFKRKLPELTGELKMIRSYRYGDTVLTVYRKKKEIEKIGGFSEKNCNLSGNL